jgi:phage FluMu protein Com
MKIIKRGTVPTPDSEKVHKGTCHNCKTVIEFQQKEAKLFEDYDDRGYATYLTIDCPVCNKSIYKTL